MTAGPRPGSEVDRRTPIAPESVRPTAVDLCRPATTVTESIGVLDAWRAVRTDPDHCAVVVRGRRALAVVTCEGLAERWWCHDPEGWSRMRLREVLDRPVGTTTIPAHTPLTGVARRMIGTGRGVLPVSRSGGRLLGVIGWVDVMAALLDLVPSASDDAGGLR